MNEIHRIWASALEILKTEVNETSYAGFLARLVPLRLANGQFYLSADNPLTVNVVSSKYLTLIREALRRVTGTEICVAVGSAGDKPVSIAPRAKAGSTFRFDPRYTFDSFVVGECNKFAFTAALAAARSPGTAYNPLYIYGGAGLGKTHLLYAVGSYIKAENPQAKVLYTSAEAFTNEMIFAIQQKQTAAFRDKYRGADALLLDGIEFFAGKEKTQEEFCHTFNALYDAGRRIVITGDRAPHTLDRIHPKLISRLQWNLIAPMHMPDVETRRQLLLRKAAQEGLAPGAIPEEVIAYLANTLRRDIRELEGALLRLIRCAGLLQVAIDLPLAERLSAREAQEPSRCVTPAAVKAAVCRYYGISAADMESAKRTKDIAFSRQIAMYLCRELTDLSMQQIGSQFGGKTHTTILYACEKISDALKTDSALKAALSAIREAL